MIVILLFLGASFASWNQIPVCYFRASEKPIIYLIMAGLQTSLLIVVVYFLLIKNGLGLIGVILSIVLVELTCFVVIYVLFKKDINSKIDLKIIGRITQKALPLMPYSILIWLNNFSDRFIIKYNSFNEELGLYTLAFQFGLIIQLIGVGINSTWGPLIAKIIRKQENNKNLNNIMSQCTYIVLLLIITICFLGKIIVINFLNNDYYGAIKDIPVIVWCFGFCFLYGFPSSILIAKGQTNKLAKIALITFLINFGGNIILVPILKEYGAAIMTLISYIIMTIIAILATKNIKEIDLSYIPLIKIVSIAICAFTISWKLSNDSTAINIIIYLVCASFLYFISKTSLIYEAN